MSICATLRAAFGAGKRICILTKTKRLLDFRETDPHSSRFVSQSVYRRCESYLARVAVLGRMITSYISVISFNS